MKLYEEMTKEELLKMVKKLDKELLHKTNQYEILRHRSSAINNIINEFDKWLLGEQMMFYRGSDERLIRFGETKNKWLELKGSDKE